MEYNMHGTSFPPSREATNPSGMRRRRKIPAMLVSMAVAVCLASSATVVTGEPNIVFMFCDDLRYDCIGANGNEIIHTPNIDSLAAKGVSFDKAFVTTAICVTSRANIMTGQYAARSGWRHGRVGGSLTPAKLAMTYHGILKSNGYQVGYVGKYHVGSPPKDFFDYNGAFGGQGRYLISPSNHLTAHLGDQAMEALDQFSKNKGQPFVLSVGFKAPHVQDGNKPPFYPYDEKRTGHLYRDVIIPPAPLSEPEFFNAQPAFIRDSKNLNRLRWTWRLQDPKQYQRSVKGYYRCVSGVDLVVGRVIEKLEQLDLSDNTIVVFSSEHGVYLGQRGLAGKWMAHEPSIHIPLVVFDPRLPTKQRGTRRNEMALTIDLAPTFLDWAGIDKARRMQGESLAPIVRGKTPSDWRTEFFYDHYYIPDRIPPSEAVRTEEWKYIRYVQSQPLTEEMYNLANDPLEAKNLAGDPEFSEQLAVMRRKWAQWRERVK